MAEESNDGQEKTEEPTQRKIDKAREDGKILTSKEMFVFSTMAMGLILMGVVPMIGEAALVQWRSLFIFDAQILESGLPITRLSFIIRFVLLTTLVFGVPLMVIILLTQLVVGGINFAPKSFAFKGNRINLFKGLGRIFSVKGLVELGKSVLKVVLLFGIAAYVVYRLLPNILYLSSGTLRDILGLMQWAFPFLVGAMSAALLVIAAIDYAWQRYSHTKSLRMSHQELKDESKQTDGSPEVKAKIRRMQMEQAQNSARERASLDQVSEATAIITNPTHFAVAVRYVPGQMSAPIIVAAGRGQNALEIIKRAETHEITVFRSQMLARALYFTSQIGAEISEKLYNALAVALAYIYRIERGEELEEPDIELPEDMLFSETGAQLRQEGADA